MNTTNQNHAIDVPLGQLLAAEAALICPDIDLAEWVRVGRQAIDMAEDPSVDAPRRAAAQEIGIGIASGLATLAGRAVRRRLTG